MKPVSYLLAALALCACGHRGDAQPPLRAEQARAEVVATPGGTRLPERLLCHRSGCFGEVCVPAEQNVFTECTWNPHFVASRSGDCEPQPDGRCGFTPH